MKGLEMFYVPKISGHSTRYINVSLLSNLISIVLFKRIIINSTPIFFLFFQAISDINEGHILEPLCLWLYTENSPRRSLIKKFHSRVSPLKCRVNFHTFLLNIRY